MINLVWFRRDLRLTDNTIVAKSTNNSLSTVYFFVLDEWFLSRPEIGEKRVKFMFECLQDLDSQLVNRGGKLHIFVGDSVAIIKQLTDYFVSSDLLPVLWFNKDIQEEYGLCRDREITKYYISKGLYVNQELNYFLQDSEAGMDTWRKCYYAFQNKSLLLNGTFTFYSDSIPVRGVNPHELFRLYPRFSSEEKSFFVGGEQPAGNLLDTFVKQRSAGYHWKLSRPLLAQQGSTSHLSPHIAFGTISSRQVYQETKRQANVFKESGQGKRYFALRAFRDRLRWRDSFTQRLYLKPWLKWKNRFAEFDSVYADNGLSPQQNLYFEAWKSGLTGFPLVDASMRQLKAIGWMNFRMRAMCANFLTIILGISWHHGARYFMQQLVDGDIAINHWQWQMQAGITNPLSKTFRIYNPTKNLLEKDPDAKFVHYWLPELRPYSVEQIISAGPLLPLAGYPEPVINYEECRKKGGKIIADLRKQVRARLLGSTIVDQESKANSEAIEYYMRWKNKEYNKWIKKQP